MKKRNRWGRWTRWTSVGLCGVLTAAVLLTGCGGSGSAADETYTMWIYSGADSSYYTDYAENPGIVYAESKTWGPEDKTVDLEFWVPASGTASDSYNTMIGSGDYPDVLDASIADAPKTMYEQGIILDLTEEIQENMPNYMAYLEAHPDLEPYAYTNVDGENRMLSLVSFADGNSYYFCGPQYRRDWLVKYGTNPFTGQAFTGGYTDAENVDSWEDDVVFPSGGTDPVYISDWEWMFGIFEKAQEDLGIDDSYVISLYYPGYTWTGDMTSCFGGGNVLWSASEENGDQVTFGADSQQFRTYLECMNTWYEKGWLDQSFNERTGDAHYAIDDTAVRQGLVGMWVGMEGELGGRLDLDDKYTDGIFVAGCSWPINDVYGPEECRNKVPNCTTTPGKAGISYYITTAAEDKDLATLLSFFDYFYSEEGSVIRTVGLNAEQVAEVDEPFYQKMGLADGAYTITDEGKYLQVDQIRNSSGDMKTAVACTKIPGITLIDQIDLGYEPTLEKSLQSWIQYKNTANFIGSAVTTNMTSEEANEVNQIQNRILDYLSQTVPEFIMGDRDVDNDAEWDSYSRTLKKYNYEKASEIYQNYVDIYPFR